MSFSQLVDEIVTLSRKANLRDSHIVPYLNATIREAQTLEFFYRDRVEDQIAITTEPSFTWDRPRHFRNIETVEYPLTEGYFGAPKKIPRIVPSRLKDDDFYYYYGGPTYFVFNGVTNGTTINIAYWAYSRRFIYYAEGSRPAWYDFEDEVWKYDLGAGTDAEKEAAREKVWHWLFDDWYEMVKAGTLAKVYKDVEDRRAPATYSAYRQMLRTFQASEPKEAMQL